MSQVFLHLNYCSAQFQCFQQLGDTTFTVGRNGRTWTVDYTVIYCWRVYKSRVPPWHSQNNRFRIETVFGRSWCGVWRSSLTDKLLESFSSTFSFTKLGDAARVIRFQYWDTYWLTHSCPCCRLSFSKGRLACVCPLWSARTRADGRLSQVKSGVTGQISQVVSEPRVRLERWRKAGRCRTNDPLRGLYKTTWSDCCGGHRAKSLHSPFMSKLSPRKN